MSKIVLKITGDTAHRAICSHVMKAPLGYVVTIAEPSRNLEQSAKFHAICSDIAKQKEFAGKLRTPDQWKVLLISGHAVVTKQGSEMLPGLEGEWCNLRESSARMSMKRMASLIEYSQAYADMNGVKLSDSAPERWAA